jgi:hypothetical protein
VTAPASRALGIAVEEARLFAEATRLTEAFHERLRAGDDSGSEEFVGRRSEILARLAALDRPADGDDATATDAVRVCRRQGVESIERLLALDREVTALLQARLAGLRAHLVALAQRRRALDGYRAHGPVSAAYADRIG